MANADAGDRRCGRAASRGDRKTELTMHRRLLALLLSASASIVHAQTWRTLDVSRQLRDTSEHRIMVRYGAGTFSLRPTTDPVLFSMQLRYVEDRTRHFNEYESFALLEKLGI